MICHNWTKRVAQDEAHRRAGGRRAYNAGRQLEAAIRRQTLLELLAKESDPFKRGIQTRLAKALKVSVATVCRDIAYLKSRGASADDEQWACAIS
jgi:hypothetical protein